MSKYTSTEIYAMRRVKILELLGTRGLMTQSEIAEVLNELKWERRYWSHICLNGTMAGMVRMGLVEKVNKDGLIHFIRKEK